MSLRLKAILIFTILAVLLTGGFSYYVQYYLKNYIEDKTKDDFQVLAEVSEGAYFLFIDILKTRTIDWSSDGFIRTTTEQIVNENISTKKRGELVNQLSNYLKEEKIKYDQSAKFIDILDKNGIIIVSSDESRIGDDREIKEEGVESFERILKSSFGETSVSSLVYDYEGSRLSEPYFHAMTRIFSENKNMSPLDVVLVVHYADNDRLVQVLTGKHQISEGAMTGRAFFDKYKTAKIYLENKDGYILIPFNSEKKEFSFPAKACFNDGKEVAEEYVNTDGKNVLGASMCLKKFGVVLVVEVEKSEILAPLEKAKTRINLIALAVAVLGTLSTFVMTTFLLRNLRVIVNVAEKISNNNLKERVSVSSKDEIGYLSKVFNRMLDSLENYYKNIDKKEEELKKEVSFVRLLQNVSMLANESTNVDNLIIKTVEEVCRFLDWNVGHYYIFDEDSKQLKPSELWHFNEPAKYESFKKLIMGINFDSGDGFVGSAYETNLPVFVSDIAKDKILAESGIKKISEVKSAFAFPLIVNSQVVVVLDLYNNKTERMDEELLKVLNNVAIQLGRAIEKTRAEEELKRNIAKGELIKVALYNILEDMKESENIIKKEHHRMAAVTSSIGEGLFVVDKDFKIILINPTAQRLLEVSEKEAVGKKIKDIVKVLKNGRELEGKDHLLASVMKEEKTYIAGPQDNIFYQTLSGKIFPVTEVGTPLKDGIVGAVIVFKDITGDKAIDEARTNFVSTTSHQLRTPLTSMKWFSEMLVNGDAGALNKEQESYVQNIYQSIERMIAVVNLLLQIARVEAGRLKIEPVAVDLRKVAEEAVAVFKSTLESKSQKVEITTEPENLPTVLMDKDVIDQVMQNLLSNAIRYAPISKTIRIFITVKDNDIEFSIKDDGIGIPQEQKIRVFEKFFRADNALKMVPEGSGLGLSLVKMLVDSWGGKIWFESEEGNGTTFFFTIPLKGMKFKEGEVKLTV